MMWGWGWGPGGYGGYGGPLIWIGHALGILVFIAIIVGIVFLVRYLVRQSRRAGSEDSALEILKRRYAKGEISKEEYAEKRRDLT
jgi:putative membrane protein